MNDLFANIYEVILGVFHRDFWLIFQVLFEDGGYNFLGATFILIPLFLFAIFYFLWKYPYGKLWHWLVWLFVIFLVASFVSWGISYNEIFLSNNQSLNDALADPESGYEHYAKTLPLKYALYNGLLSVVLGFLFSLILKQFSKIQIHLPF